MTTCSGILRSKPPVTRDNQPRHDAALPFVTWCPRCDRWFDSATDKTGQPCGAERPDHER